MTKPVANLTISTDNFGDWIDRTNQLADAMSNIVLTTNAPVTGNCTVNGSITTDNVNVDNISSRNANTITFTTDVSIENLKLTGANVDFGLAGNIQILGGNTTNDVLAIDPSTDKLKFVNAVKADANGDIHISGDVYANDLRITGTVNFDLGNVHLKKNLTNLLHTSYTSGTAGDTNLFIGQNAGNENIGQGFVNTYEGCNNVGIGKSAGFSLTTGYQNVAIGSYSLDAETTGYNNVAVGHAALTSQTGTSYNTSIGYSSGYDVTTGNLNTFLGYNTGRGVTTGTNNTFIGPQINLGNVSNNIALSTGDGTVRLRYDGSKWVNSEKITWLDHVNAELHFDSAVSDGYGVKRITCNDGGGNWNFRSGEYYNVANAQLEYSTADQSAAHIRINTENSTGGEVYLTTYGPNTTGVAGSAVERKRAVRILNQNDGVEYYDGATWHQIWHQGNISPRITALPSATPANITGNETVPLDTGEKLPLVNVITDSIRGLTANTSPTGNEYVAVDNGQKIDLNTIAGLASSSDIVASSLTQNGYIQFSNGLIFQWGYSSSTGNYSGYKTVTFPISFPNSCFSVVIGSNGDFHQINVDGTYRYFSHSNFIRNVSLSNFRLYGFYKSGSYSYNIAETWWLAVGN